MYDIQNIQSTESSEYGAIVRQSLRNVHMEYTFVHKQPELVVNISGEIVAPVIFIFFQY
jgi:hypothetical protein